MKEINTHFQKLQDSYLFAEVNHRVQAYLREQPDARLIRMGIGDVTLPLPKSVIEAMHRAVDDEAKAQTLRGYGPEQGYDFLREAIEEHDYRARGIDISKDEVFISDGAKSDTANIVDLFSNDVRLAITDPVYPVYVDSNVLAGRTGELMDDGRWSGISYLDCNRENGFVPTLPSEHVDVIYLCLPNNPTGTTLTRDQLQQWVDYAQAEDAIILYDGAYEAFVREEDVPRSIYELKGAKQCAIEFRSYSKTAGFTGVRCGYTVVPKDLQVGSASLNAMWRRRQTTKFNGASYISQRGAAAIYTEEGKKEVRQNIDYYLHNAGVIRDAFLKVGYEVFGGINSPYVWVKTPDAYPQSWDFFEYLLREKQVIGTPGVGFGQQGEGYFRFSAFGSTEDTREAMERMLK